MQRKIDDEMRLATVSQAAPTQAPTLASAVGTRTAWRSRSAAAGVIALALGLAGCGGSSNDDPPVDAPAPPADTPVPPPVDTPAPPPNVPAPPPAVDPTPAGFTKTGEILTVAGSVDVGDTYTAGARTVVYDSVNNRYYELVTPAAPVGYAVAKQAAVDAGGILASPSSLAKMAFIKVALASQLPLGGAASGGNGAWIGLEQAPGGAAPGDNWSFLDATPLPGTSALWNKPTEPNDGGNTLESNAENFGAIFAGKTAAETDLEMIYDAGVATSLTQPKYLIEYATKELIVLAP